MATRLPHVRQRSRWWPFPVLYRRVKTPTTSDATENRAIDVSASNGHVPTVIGRTQTMLSPVKATTAGALVFALGGLFLVAQPFGQQGSVPGAEQGAEPAPPVEVTITPEDGTDLEPEQCTTRSGDPSATVGVDASACTRAASYLLSASDPRLSGTATILVIEYLWPGRGAIYEAYAIEIVNDEGAWVGTGRHVAQLDQTMYTLTGERAYEGLTAVLGYGPDSEEPGWKGVIVEGGLPPFPEPIE